MYEVDNVRRNATRRLLAHVLSDVGHFLCVCGLHWRKVVVWSFAVLGRCRVAGVGRNAGSNATLLRFGGGVHCGRSAAAIVFMAVHSTPGAGQRLAGCQTLEGSFSSVWTATIARKDAFCRHFRDLQDLHSFAPL